MEAWSQDFYVGQSGAFRVPIWPLYLVIAIGCTVLALQFVSRRPAPPVFTAASVAERGGAGLEQLQIGPSVLMILVLIYAGMYVPVATLVSFRGK
jgi:hypothetical protein